MPTIKVNEKDLSWYYRQRDPGQLSVLMPGLSSFGPVDRPVYVNQSNFYKVLGSRVVDFPEDISFDMAESFAKSGIEVLFWRINFLGATEDEISSATATSKELIGASTWTKSNFADKLSNFAVNAKYPGKFGNSLSIRFIGSGDTVRYFVYCNRGSTSERCVEDALVNFVDPLSEYYYETVNNDSKYVTFVVTKLSESSSATTSEGTESSEEGSTTTTTTPTSSAYISLSGGKDYIKETSSENGDLAALGLPDDSSEEEKSPLSTFIEKLGDSTVDSVFVELRDPLIYTFTVAIDGGFNDVEVSSGRVSRVDSKFLSLCKSKANAVYLVSGAKTSSAEEFYSYCGSPKQTESTDAESFDTSYAAAYGPWGHYKLVSSGVVRELPGYYPFLVRWANSLEEGSPIWMAPAGVKRSNLGGLVKSTNYPVGSAVLDLWQNQSDIEAYESGSSSYKVNPITELKQYGYVIYGNSTLLRNGADGSTSMLQSFSTRILANLIKNKAFDISLTLQFDQTDDDLFAEFKTLMSVFMDQLKYGGALYDYKIIADRSEMTLDQLNSRTVPVRIMISPNPAVENFIINLEISQAGVTFSDDADGSTTEAA